MSVITSTRDGTWIATAAWPTEPGPGDDVVIAGSVACDKVMTSSAEAVRSITIKPGGRLLRTTPGDLYVNGAFTVEEGGYLEWRSGNLIFTDTPLDGDKGLLV